MPLERNSKALGSIVDQLSTKESLKGLFHQHLVGYPLPSTRAIKEIVQICRSIFFPGYFGASKVNQETVHYHIGVNIERLYELLSEQIVASICVNNLEDLRSLEHCSDYRSLDQLNLSKSKACTLNQKLDFKLCEDKIDLGAKQEVEGKSSSEQPKSLSHDIYHPFKDDSIKEMAGNSTLKFIQTLPELRALLALDVEEAFRSDPAARSLAEVICCYPGIRAIANYRIAHELFKLGIPLLPRAISEMAHSETGIDIHPGAQIGSHFCIDHGTGIVIGETCIIGNHVHLFQGVTLGAKSFVKDEQGIPLNVPRHPILEDNVIVYSNASVLGRITIGKNAIIGGNVWITEDVPENGRVISNIQSSTL